MMLIINIMCDVLTNGSVGTVTTLGASLMYSSMVVRNDGGGWKGQPHNNEKKLRMKLGDYIDKDIPPLEQETENS